MCLFARLANPITSFGSALEKSPHRLIYLKVRLNNALCLPVLFVKLSIRASYLASSYLHAAISLSSGWIVLSLVCFSDTSDKERCRSKTTIQTILGIPNTLLLNISQCLAFYFFSPMISRNSVVLWLKKQLWLSSTLSSRAWTTACPLT